MNPELPIFSTTLCYLERDDAYLMPVSYTHLDVYKRQMLYVTTLIATISRIVEFAEQFQRGMTGIERFAEIMDTPVTLSLIHIFKKAHERPCANRRRTRCGHPFRGR